MFREWGFLLTEIWGLLALAVLLGLVAGWLIWGGRGAAASQAELFRLQTQLDRERARTKAALAGPNTDIPPMQNGGYRRPTPPPVSFPTAPPTDETPADETPVEEALTVPTPPPDARPPDARPMGLDAPRDGIPDDLTKINGIGPKLAKLCNSLGFYHYDQIAQWSADEIAWVDDNLEGFKGRVTRDRWVQQARALAKGDVPQR